MKSKFLNSACECSGLLNYLSEKLFCGNILQLNFSGVKNYLAVALFVVFALCSNDGRAETLKPSFFKKHIMVIVDQSPDAIREADMKILYSGIKNFLEGKEMPDEIDMNKSDLPSNFEFNPETDELSLYAFGLGGLHTGGDWDKIYSNASEEQYTSDEFFNDISQGLIHHRSSFSKSGKEFSDYLTSDLNNLFTRKDPLSINFSGVTMSHYVYPNILNFIDYDSKASEYYFVIVTNYKDGAGNADGADEERIKELAGTNKAFPGKYAASLNSLKRPFYTINWMQMRALIKDPKNYVNGMQLGVKSLQGVSIYIASNVELEQTSLNRNIFIMRPVEISFNKNNTLHIDSIHLSVSDEIGNRIIVPLSESEEMAESWFDADKRLFLIPEQKVNLADIHNLDDLEFEYQFFTTIIPEMDGKAIPYVFTAKANINKNAIIFINDQNRNMIIALCIIGVIIIFLWIMILRGRKRTLSASVHNFTTRFSLTTPEEGTIELPCWFVGEGQKSEGIKVDGSITPVCGQPRMPRKDILKVTIDNVDIPDGVSVCLNGNRDMVPKENVYYPIPLEDGKFKFTVNFWVNESVMSSDGPIRVQLRLRYKTETKLGFLTHTQYHPGAGEDTELIDFYIMPEIGTGWMGIDPGTSGSCVAVGRGGAIANPNIHLVENDGEKIVPSKVIFDNKDLTDVETAEPGKQYTYGAKANKVWIARSNSGYKCFQSIKKLLGYQNGENNRICITFPNSTTQFELSGMDIARLLVKGLLKDTDDFVNTLPTHERNELLPNGTPIRRAVVAIPNNYTLPKTIDMVKSVALSGRFQEVRPIFEAEAILCNYLSKTFGEVSNGSKNIVVYDMGGATINLTVFRVDYKTMHGSIYYTIHTLGRIGYAVGGDNIDYALMRHIFSITNLGNGQKAKDYQEQNKVKILNEILRLKKNLIKFDYNSSEPGEEMLASFDAFNEFVREVTGQPITSPKYLEYQIGEDDQLSSINFTRFAVDLLCANSADIKRYVRDKVKEVTKEILTYPDVKNLNSLDLVIFSGRSVLFPNIKRWALRELKNKFGKFNEWDGLSGEDVKTAVAYGACWYGTFNSLVTLDNSRVASAYGFKLTKDGETKLVSMIDQNASFGENQTITATEKVASNFASDGSIIEFFQIMGSPEGNDLFDKKNRYKVNKIGEIPINVTTEEISIEVKRSNMVDFGVLLETGTEIIKNDVTVSDRDITDENDEAYIFATSTPRSINLQQN